MKGKRGSGGGDGGVGVTNTFTSLPMLPAPVKGVSGCVCFVGEARGARVCIPPRPVDTIGTCSRCITVCAS